MRLYFRAEKGTGVTTNGNVKVHEETTIHPNGSFQASRRNFHLLMHCRASYQVA